MKIWNRVKKFTTVFCMAFFLSIAVFPATDVCAAAQQTQAQAETKAAAGTQAAQDDGFELLILGGGLLIILFAVVTAVATMSSVFGLTSVSGGDEEE